MSINLARTAEAWWAVTPAGLVRLPLPAATTADLLADGPALAAAIEAIKALRDKGNEIDLRALRGLIKAMGS